MGRLRVIDLFAGIGGFSLGLERTGGFETAAFCEIDAFCRRVLAKHWPTVRQYDDVRTLTADTLRRDGIAVDVITAGFPCQDVSTAGRMAGLTAETRSGLWSEVLRLTGELRPGHLILENVSNLLRGPSHKPGGWFGRVLGDLAQIGYDAEWQCISASRLGAPHERDRVWIIAYPNEKVSARLPSGAPAKVSILGSDSQYSRGEKAANPEQGQRPLGQSAGGVGRIFQPVPWHRAWPIASEPVLGRGADGVPNRVDRVGACGNAVVPAIPELIGNAILASLEQQRAAA